jgi:hypothetical protein
LPSRSYAPPWHGQLNAAGVTSVSVTSPTFVSTFFSSSARGPLACTGQPRCTQRFEMIVKLGTPALSSPLLRM